MRPQAPRPIQPTDPLDEFDCGTSELNDWLRKKALRNEKSGDSRTYASIDTDSGAVVGFYSLSAGSICRATAGRWLGRNAPDPVPVVRLGRLAVSVAAQGLGLGRDLVVDAMENAMVAAGFLGARALIADAKDEQAASFYRHLGFDSPISDRPLTMAAKISTFDLWVQEPKRH